MIQNYFLGSNSPEGFRSYFSDMLRKEGYYTYILKGGPGTGKSTLMKKIAAAFDDDTDLYHCSSDVKSLDAVVMNKRKIIITDGTSPHCEDPDYPGIYQEIIDLGTCLNKEKLKKNRDTITELFKQNKEYHTRATRYIQSGASLNKNIFSIAESSLDTEKTDKYACKLCEKLFRSKNDTKIHSEIRTISAFTASGYSTLTLSDDYNINIIADDDASAADRIIRQISAYASHSGYMSYISMCHAFSNEICEHIIIPELKTAFLSSNHINRYDQETCTTINAGKFYNKKLLSSKKIFTSFNKKVTDSIYAEVALSVKTALDIHNEIEKYYIDSLNTERLNEITEMLISRISESC